MSSFIKKYASNSMIIRTMVVVLLLFGPINFFNNNGIINLLVQCLIYAAFGISWNIIAGYGGQISYCHCAFISIGAYVSAIGFAKFSISPLITLPLGIALSYAFATFMGQACFRYRGPLFGITTIAFAELLRIALLICSDLTEGARGIMVTFRGQNFFNMQFDSDIPYYYIRLGDTHAAENRERSHDDGNGDGQLAARSVGDRTDRRVKRLGGVEDADGTGDDEGANDQHGRVDAGLRDVHDHLPGTDGGLINVVERIGVDNVLPVYLHKIVGTSGNDVGCDGCHHEQNEKDDKHMGHCKLFFLFHFLLSPCCFLFGRMPVRFSFSSDVLCIAAFRIGAMLLSLPFR